MIPREDPHLATISRLKIETLENEGVSDLQPWSAFIFSACTIFVVGICYLNETFLLDAVYGLTYRKLVEAARIDGHDRRRRAFVTHHLAFTFKTLLVFVAAYPIMRLFLPGPDGFRTPLRAPDGQATIGDILLVAGQLYCAYYTWELCYRAGLASYISILHHTVLLVVAQLGMALSAHPETNQDASMEFYMCLVWGVFDIVSELPVHLTMILYRTVPENRRSIVSVLFFFCTTWCLCCTLAEMAISGYLLKCSWSRWEKSFRIATPVALAVWGLAQCISSWQVFCLARVERKNLKNRENGDDRGYV